MIFFEKVVDEKGQVSHSILEVVSEEEIQGEAPDFEDEHGNEVECRKSQNGQRFIRVIGVVFDRESYGLEVDEDNKRFRISFLVQRYRLVDINGKTFNELNHAKGEVMAYFKKQEPTYVETFDEVEGKALVAN